MKKILMICTVEFEYNGITKVIKNILEYMDLSNYCVDMVVGDKYDATVKNSILPKINKFYDLGFRKQNLKKYISSIYKLMKNNKYDVVHIHGNSSTMSFESITARICHVKKIIAHCHNNKTTHPYLNTILNPFLKLTITDALACSDSAGRWLFGKYPFHIYKNGIEVEKYFYKIGIREKIRNQLELGNELIIGHVGLFNNQKNQRYLLSVLEALADQGINAKLLLIGNGPLESEFKKIASEKGLESRIVILEHRADVNELLMAMDVFAFPSKWEGFGIAILEAQASGLKCIASNNVSKEVNISEKLEYVSLEDLNKWVLLCSKTEIEGRVERSKDAIEKIIIKGYDVKSNVNKMVKEYY